MTKRLLADVLWQAANRHISVDGTAHYPEEYSCHAAMCSEFGRNWRAMNYADSVVVKFLSTLGCDPNSAGFNNSYGRGIQSMRYMWLLLAMHVAESEGIEI